MPIQTTLTLNPGITVLMVAVETVGDELAEGDEILIGRLTSEHPLVTLGVSQATVIILDDDGKNKQHLIIGPKIRMRMDESCDLIMM